MPDTLERLAETIAARRHASAGESYVASLFAKGLPHVARKMGEEAVETVVAALSGDPRALAGEAADLLFHLLVLLEKRGVALADVLAELERREGTSGHDEKAARLAEPVPAPVDMEPEPLELGADVALPLLDVPETAPLLAMGDGGAAPRKRIRKG